MGSLKRRAWHGLAISALALSTAAGTASALSMSDGSAAEEAVIRFVTAGNLQLDGDQIQGSGALGSNRFSLPPRSMEPACIQWRTVEGERVCTWFSEPPQPTVHGDVAGDLSASDDDRYYIDPIRDQGALRVDLAVNALKSEVDRVEVSVELAQAHSTRPVYAYLYNFETGRYDVVASYAGTVDGVLIGSVESGGSAYVSGTGTLTLMFVNADQGLSTASGGALYDGFFVDYVQVQVADAVVPEPTAALLTLVGLLGLAHLTRRGERSRSR